MNAFVLIKDTECADHLYFETMRAAQSEAIKLGFEVVGHYDGICILSHGACITPEGLLGASE